MDMAAFAKAKEPLLRGFLQLPGGIPTHDTFSRLFRPLDPDAFGAAFQRFMAAFSKQCQGVVVIDGKILRRSHDKASGKIGAAHDQRLGLRATHGAGPDRHGSEVQRDHGGTETAGDAAEGHIVTVDALNCRRAIAQQIIDQDGDYALALKGNQLTMHADVSLFSTTLQPPAPRRRERSMEIMGGSRPAPPRFQPISTGYRRTTNGPASRLSEK